MFWVLRTKHNYLIYSSYQIAKIKRRKKFLIRRFILLKRRFNFFKRRLFFKDSFLNFSSGVFNFSKHDYGKTLRLKCQIKKYERKVLLSIILHF